MVKILIIDDDSNKIHSIVNKIGNIEFDPALSLSDACRALQKNQYDLIILDIALPDRVGDDINNKAGINFIHTIVNTNTINKPTHIIGITSHDELYLETKKFFDLHTWHLIKYDPKDLDWAIKIKNKIKYIINWKSQFSEDALTVDYAIVTAVDVEFKAFYNLPLKWEKTILRKDSTIYYRGEINSYNIILAQQQQMGMVASAALTTKIIDTFKPYMVIMGGIAAGLKEEVNLCDIIIADESWDYGSGKISASEELDCYYKFDPEPHQITISPYFNALLKQDFLHDIQEIRNTWNKTSPNPIIYDSSCKVGALPSGASVIQDEQLLKEVVKPQHRKTLGIDMETYGVYFASKYAKSHTEYISIKTVCDFADENKNNNYQAYSAFLSANFIYKLIKKDMLKDNGC